MSINYSTGAKNAMAGTVGLKGAFTDFVIDIYSGARPTSADTAPTGTKLVRITLDAGASAYLNFLAASAGTIAKDVAVTWRGLALADGTMGYARVCLPGDAGGVSTSAYRMDLTVGVSGADLNMSNLSTTASPASPHAIESFQIGF